MHRCPTTPIPGRSRQADQAEPSPAAEAAAPSRGRRRGRGRRAELRGRAPSRRPEAAAAARASATTPRRPPRQGGEVNKDGVDTQGPQIQAILREQQLDKQGRAYATGRRKDAVARVWLKPGTGKIIVNGRDQEVYFARPTLRLIINQVFDIADREGQYDVDRHGTASNTWLMISRSVGRAK